MLIEIWRNEDGGSHTLSVNEHNDQLLHKIAPKAVCVHSYWAASDFEVFRLNNEWHGYPPWIHEPDWEERAFTDKEQREQEAYLLRRNV